MTRPVSVRQPSTSSGRYWIPFEREADGACQFIEADRDEVGQRARLISDQKPSVGLISGAYLGSATRASQSCSAANWVIRGIHWVRALSQMTISGAPSC